MTHLHTLTWADFKKFEPCYDPQERYGDFSGTILDILKDKRIPAKDRIWAATRKGMLDDRTLRLFACKCVREVWHLLTDERSRKAVEVAELYAVGEATDEELGAARDAASAAASAAARAAASAAARDAAWGAAWDAARDAAWGAAAARDAASAAARDAASSAAWDAARDAARDKQIMILIQLIENQ